MLRGSDKWLWGYARSIARRPRRVAGTRHLMFCVADHFEPLGCKHAELEDEPGPTREARIRRVEEWRSRYPEAVKGLHDADGRPPRHTFFCAQDDYDPEWMRHVASLCAAGFGEVELHLHHRGDTRESLREKLVAFRDRLRNEHGLLGSWGGAGVRGQGSGVRGEGTEEEEQVSGVRSMLSFRGRRGRGISELGEGMGYPSIPLGMTEGERFARDDGEKSASLGMRGASRGGAGDRRQRTEDGGQKAGSESAGKLSPQSSIINHQSAIAYGFVHGNWALCNSRPDGDWCGVNEELGVLADAGCYADFTFPSAPSPTQPRMVNAIYRARDRAAGRGADSGVRCQVSGVRRRLEDGGQRTDDRNWMAEHEAPDHRSIAFSTHPSILRPFHPSQRPLLLIQGPLALDWRRRKRGIFPRLDTGAITQVNPPTPARIDLWARQHIHVLGRPEWVFVKAYTHGAVPSSGRVFLGDGMRLAHKHLRERYNDGQQWRLHYVTARELYNIARAAEDGREGDPGEFRDYEISPPPCLCLRGESE